MADGTQTEIARMVCRHQGQVRGGEEEDGRRLDPAQMQEGVQQDGRRDGQTKGRDLDGDSGEPQRTLHKAKSVHLSFPCKAVELTNWSGTFWVTFPVPVWSVGRARRAVEMCLHACAQPRVWPSSPGPPSWRLSGRGHHVVGPGSSVRGRGGAHQRPRHTRPSCR